ncbi:MAG: AI-2E family transporter, partial [Gemmatimonadetes bacterium]|nr:AI-2E family transporter [Gemmatimonadota bacterium]
MSTEHEQVSVPPGAVAPPGHSGATPLRPEHLYKTAGLLFLLALVYRYFAELTHTFLLLYAAALFAVVLNAVVARVPFRRKWVTAAIGILIVGGIGSLVWFGVPVLVTQVRNLSAQAPRFEATLQGWEAWIQANTGLNVHLVGPEAQRYFQETFRSTGGGNLLGRAQGVFEILLIPLLVLFGALFAVGKPNEQLLSPALRAVPRRLRPAVRRIFELLGVRIIGWMKGTLIGMACVGGLTYLFLTLIGVP